MQIPWGVLILACAVTILPAQEKTTPEKSDGPTSEKAQKSYKDAMDGVHTRQLAYALESFKKADKQDGGHCAACERKMIQYAEELRDWKTAELAASELVANADTPKKMAFAHFQFGVVLFNEGREKRKDEFFSRAHDEMTKALEIAPKFPDALLGDGQALAHLNRDEEAKGRFEQYVNLKPENDINRQRALRYISEPELARARMAPPFAVTTSDGQTVSLDSLTGKVVLVDFWATWCPPCREAVPHLREIVKKFQGQPLVVLSVSLDKDESKWKEFVAKNGMTWPQYREEGSPGVIAKQFGVNAIPHTFTIDADGILQDEHIGDSAMEGKLKKLVAQARDLQAEQKPAGQ